MTIRRRDFITLLGGAAAAWPLAARAQQGGQPKRVGALMNYAATQRDGQAYFSAFTDRLRQLGWNAGQNLRLDVRWNAGDAELAKIYGAQLIGLMPDVILASSTYNLSVIQQATSTVPIVFAGITGPVEQGIVPSLAHPGGNITGFASSEFSIGGKWLELLKQVAPGLKRVAVMFNPETSPQSNFYMRAIDPAAVSLDVKSVALPVRTPSEIEPAMVNFTREPNGGLILPTDSFTRLRFSLIADIAVRYRLPSVAPSGFTNGGGLISYFVSAMDEYRGAADYVDRILKGAKPSDLPVQLGTRFQLSINLKTAKAIGLTIPESLLLTADEVIE
jgi:putative tryptophan/tyrosine transport system substrate-binding protein